MSNYTLIYCSGCAYEYEIEDSIITSYSGREDILCSTCGDVLFSKELIKCMKNLEKCIT